MILIHLRGFNRAGCLGRFPRLERFSSFLGKIAPAEADYSKNMQILE